MLDLLHVPGGLSHLLTLFPLLLSPCVLNPMEICKVWIVCIFFGGGG